MPAPQIIDAATHFLRGDTSAPGFTFAFRTAMSAVSAERPLDGVEVELFDALEGWEASNWQNRPAAVDDLRAAARRIVNASQATTHVPSKIGRLGRVRTSTRVTAEATAFALMFLGLSTAVYMARTFWNVDLLAPISYPLPLVFVVVGTGLMWASNKLILTEKCVALALTVASPIVAHYAFLHLPGHPQESCESGYSTDSHGHIFDRYDTCSHANWATQTVEGLLILVPLIVFMVFLFRARRQSTIKTLGQPRPNDNRPEVEVV